MLGIPSRAVKGGGESGKNCISRPPKIGKAQMCVSEGWWKKTVKSPSKKVVAWDKRGRCKWEQPRLELKKGCAGAEDQENVEV